MVNRCRLQFLFLFDSYWPAFICCGTEWFSECCTSTDSCWSFADAVRFRLHRLRVSVPEPCPVSDVWHQSLDRVLDRFAYCLLFLMLPVPIPNAWYPSTFFADHTLSLSSRLCRLFLVSCRLYYQWLHLFQRIVNSCSIILMQLPKFSYIWKHRFCCLKQPVTEWFTSSVADFCLSLVFPWTACY